MSVVLFFVLQIVLFSLIKPYFAFLLFLGRECTMEGKLGLLVIDLRSSWEAERRVVFDRTLVRNPLCVWVEISHFLRSRYRSKGEDWVVSWLDSLNQALLAGFGPKLVASRARLFRFSQVFPVKPTLGVDFPPRSQRDIEAENCRLYDTCVRRINGYRYVKFSQAKR